MCRTGGRRCPGSGGGRTRGAGSRPTETTETTAGPTEVPAPSSGPSEPQGRQQLPPGHPDGTGPGSRAWRAKVATLRDAGYRGDVDDDGNPTEPVQVGSMQFNGGTVNVAHGPGYVHEQTVTADAPAGFTFTGGAHNVRQVNGVTYVNGRPI